MISERRVDCSTVEYGYETKFVGYSLRSIPDQVDLTTAITIVEATLRPCPDAVVKKELLRLKLTTKSRTQSEDELVFQVAVYADELARYPEDVVVDALRYWGSRQKWWPAWAEMKSLLDDRCERRFALAAALRRVPRPMPSDAPSKQESVEDADPSVWFWQIMVPYIRHRLPDHRAAALISAWQVGEEDAAVAVSALDRERKLREATVE
jgi:hypothetical protein